MAKKIAEVKVVVDNGDAIRSTKKFGEEIASLTEKIASLGEKLGKKETWGANETYDSIKKQLDNTQKKLDETLKKYEASVKRIGGIDDLLGNLEGATYNVLTKTRTTLINSLKNARRNTEEEIKDYEERAKRLQKVRDEIAKRDIDVRGGMTEGRAKEVMKSLDDSSYIDIKNATEVMKKMQAFEPNADKWKEYGEQIAAATNLLKEWDDKNKRLQMIDLSKQNLVDVSDSDLQQQLRYWDGIVNGIKGATSAVKEYQDIYKRYKEEQNRRNESIVAQVIDQNQLGGSISEMQNRLKLLQDYRTTIDSTKPDAYVRVDAAIEKLTQGIKESQAGFLSYADAVKQAEGLANGTFKGSISDLDKMKKVLEEYKGTLATTDTAGLEKVNGLLGNIEQKQKELQSGYMSYAQAMDKAEKVMDGSFEGSIADLEKLQKVLAGGITANLDMYGENGAYKKMKKAEKFANRVGYR